MGIPWVTPAARAEEQAEKWREQHKVQAWFHDKGIGHATELRELEEQREAWRTQWLTAVPRIQDAILSKRNVGLDVARQLGRKGGRKPKMTDSKIASAKKLLAGGVPARDVAKNLGVSVPTLYRWVPATTHVSSAEF